METKHLSRSSIGGARSCDSVGNSENVDGDGTDRSDVEPSSVTKEDSVTRVDSVAVLVSVRGLSDVAELVVV
jgi:hypothetical protein